MGKKHYIDLDEALASRIIKYYNKVILDRQFADIRDGLKNVQRRILYTMYKEGYTSNKAFVKSMRITGNVSSIHPHGDSYDSLANLISPHNIMQPLVEGHGGFKNVMGKNSAASRYTEARLAKFTERFILKGVDKKIAPFKPNFDQTGIEPEVLPARLPLLLVNGVESIGAGGFSSYLPPHNIKDVAAYMIDLIDHPEKDGKQLIIDNELYPDFPTGGIMDKSVIPSLYEDGGGNFQVYAKLELDTESSTRHDIIRVTELPYGTTLSRDIIEPIVALTKGKTNPKSKVVNKELKEEYSVIKDLKDYSSKGKIVDYRIHVSKGLDLQAFVTKLSGRLGGLRNTQIVNMNFLNGNKLVQYTSLKDVALDWLVYRRTVILNEKMIELRDIERRKNIIDATNLVVGSDSNRARYLELAEQSKNKQDFGRLLVAEWNHLNEIQVEFLINLRIYNISKDDLAGFAEEVKELEVKKTEALKYFKDPKEVDALIKADLQEILESGLLEERIYNVTYQDGVGKEVPKADIPEENFLLIASSDNFIKKIKSDPSTAQKRSGKGRSIGKLREGAYPRDILEISSRGSLLFMTKEGNVFKLDVADIPVTNSINNLGTFMKTLLRGQTLTNLIPVEDGMLENSDLAFLIVTKKNKVKLVSVDQFSTITKAGLRMTNLQDDTDEVISASLVNTKQDLNVLCANTDGMVLNLPIVEIPSLGRTAAGVKVFSARKGKPEPTVVAATPYREVEGDTVILLTEQGKGKLMGISKFPVASRNTVGLLGTNLSDGDSVAYSSVVHREQLATTNLMVVTDRKSITFSLAELKYFERPAKGLTIKKNEEGEHLRTAALLAAN